MKKIALLFLSASFVFSCSNSKQITSESTHHTANEKRYFADTESTIRKFREDSQNYYERNDNETIHKYEDSMKSLIIGSYIREHEFTPLKGEKVSTAKMDKPLFLQVTASWCAPCKAEIPALNRIAEKYKEDADFVLLFWDTKEGLEKLENLYSSNISLVPSQEKFDDPSTISISGFKHTMGFPTDYLINKDNKIVGFSQGAASEYSYTNAEGKLITFTSQMADSLNYSRLEKEVTELIAKNK
jgi:thiol-disulfide isomerase/thioredoxin